MSLLFESIKVYRRQLFNLSYHNRRVAASRRALFGCGDELDLASVIHIPPSVGENFYKCRVVYGVAVASVEFAEYEPRRISSVRLVNATHIQYAHKFADRSGIDALLKKAGTDDVLMVVRGEIADLSFANIVFFDGKRWITPLQPMLAGTKRRSLLDQQKIVEQRLTPDDLKQFQHAAPINAMLDIGDVPFIPIEQFFF